ncbi:hypothetical protein KY366_03425 [Candidatus Woesearchaeota archaeon]|nr:hypothetical protein [Candidatus Woesearchaeota archaeon]
MIRIEDRDRPGLERIAQYLNSRLGIQNSELISLSFVLRDALSGREKEHEFLAVRSDGREMYGLTVFLTDDFTCPAIYSEAITEEKLESIISPEPEEIEQIRREFLFDTITLGFGPNYHVVEKKYRA